MKKTLITTVQNFVDEYQQQKHICSSWGTPLVGFAAATDPLFSRLRSVASPTHAVPQDFLGSSAGSDSTGRVVFLVSISHTPHTHPKMTKKNNMKLTNSSGKFCC